MVQIFGTTLTNQNSIHEESKSKTEIREYLLSFGAVCCAFQLATQKYKV
jgi:hypothetical protein